MFQYMPKAGTRLRSTPGTCKLEHTSKAFGLLTARAKPQQRVHNEVFWPNTDILFICMGEVLAFGRKEQEHMGRSRRATAE